jgi:putative ABC transport system permease protein
MNLFQLILKQMRQRSLGTCLTILSVLLGTLLAIGILMLRRGGESLFVQKDFGYDLILGSSKGSPLQLVLNTVYGLDRSPGNFPYTVYEEVASPRRQASGGFVYASAVKLAVPFARGDTYRSRQIIATTPEMFGHKFDEATGKLEAITPVEETDEQTGETEVAGRIFQYAKNKRFELAQGSIFHPKKFEAVIGAEVASKLGVKLGQSFHASHGDSKEEHHEGDHDEHEHAEQWKVVGILKPTGTANDRVIFIPLLSFYCIPEHDEAIKSQTASQTGLRPEARTTAKPEPEYTLAADGTISLKTKPDEWQLSGIYVRGRGFNTRKNLQDHVNNGAIPNVTAVVPVDVMRDFFKTFLEPGSTILVGISFLASVLAAVGILVSIYNSVSARNKEIAILRALGATRNKVLLLICLEAVLIGLIGGAAGWVGGHAIGAIASSQLERQFGQGFNWLKVDPQELIYLAAVVLISLIAGLVPALKAYQTPVATNLVAS